MAMFSSLILIFAALFLSSCAAIGLSVTIPRITDEEVEYFVRAEGRKILSVTENADKADLYEFHLASLRNGEVGGLASTGQSVGDHLIYIDDEWARQALRDGGNPHALRMTLAREIAHDIGGDASNQRAIVRAFLFGRAVGQGLSFVPGPAGVAGRITSAVFGLMGYVTQDIYNRSANLEADRKAIEYWKRLGWDCRVWIHMFYSDLDSSATEALHHPTEEHLEQAMELCPSVLDEERELVESRIADQRTRREEERRERKQDRE